MFVIKWLIFPFCLLWKHKHILWLTTQSDIKARVAGSVLGLGWIIIYPVLLLGAYAVVYIYIFKVRFGLFNTNEYILLIFCGLIPFLGFAEALGSGAPSVINNANLIKNTLFPIELISVKEVLVSQRAQVVSMVLLLIAIGIMGKLTFWAFMIVPLWSIQIFFTIGLIWILSILNVYFRDLQHIIGITIFFLMIVSPISYTPDMMPKSLHYFLYINPLYYIIISFQDVLVMGRFPRGNTFAIFAVLGFGIFIVGYSFFSKIKRAMVDYV